MIPSFLLDLYLKSFKTAVGLEKWLGWSWVISHDDDDDDNENDDDNNENDDDDDDDCDWPLWESQETHMFVHDT